MSRGETPRGTPAVARLGLLWAVLLVGIAAVAVQDAATKDGSTPSWWRSTLDQVDGLGASVLTSAVGVVLVILGVLVLLVALRPGRRTHAPVPGDQDVWITDRAVQALAEQAAEDSPGVVQAKVAVSSRRVRVTATTTGSVATTAAVDQAVSTAVSPVTDRPVSVRLKEVDA